MLSVRITDILGAQGAQLLRGIVDPFIFRIARLNPDVISTSDGFSLP